MNHKQLKFFGLIICIIMLFSSCIRLKDTVYLQGDIAQKLEDIESQRRVESVSYLVKAGDLLFIQVSSFDGQSTAFLNTGNAANANNAFAASLMGYRVGIDGQIDFPYVGKVPAAGLTLSEIERNISLSVERFVERSSVTVKLLNDNITILGEVRGSGRYPLNGEEISLLEAFAFAGDLTDMANRKKVRLIRNDDNATPKMIIIDVTDEKIMFSPYYYLKPGDIIYVEPKRFKTFQLSASIVALIASLGSFGVMIYSALR